MYYGIASSDDVTPEQRQWARQFIADRERIATLQHCSLPLPKMEPSIIFVKPEAVDAAWDDMGYILEEIEDAKDST